MIEADDRRSGEAFHTEPKAASRATPSTVARPADREEAEGYVEEIPAERSSRAGAPAERRSRRSTWSDGPRTLVRP